MVVCCDASLPHLRTLTSGLLLDTLGALTIIYLLCPASASHADSTFFRQTGAMPITEPPPSPNPVAERTALSIRRAEGHASRAASTIIFEQMLPYPFPKHKARTVHTILGVCGHTVFPPSPHTPRIPSAPKNQRGCHEAHANPHAPQHRITVGIRRSSETCGGAYLPVWSANECQESVDYRQKVQDTVP